MKWRFTNKHTRLLQLLSISWLCANTLAAQTFSGQGGMLVPPGAPAQTVGITQSPCSVSGVGVLGGCLQIESVNINIDHTFTGDVGILLIAPNGAFIDLTTGNGGGADNWTDCTFSDDPGNGFITTGAPPYTGTWRPEGRATTLNNPYSNAAPLGNATFLNTFNGINADGTWYLYVNDYVAVDWGTILNWSITFSSTGTPPVANPASLSSCPNANGLATFNLTTLNSTVNGNTGFSVSYFTNSAGTIAIPNPAAYLTATTTVYAVVNNGVCSSAPVPIDLTVAPLVLTGTPTISITPTTGCVPTSGSIVYDIGQPGVYVVNYTTVSSSGTTNSTAATQLNGTWTWNVNFTSNYTITINSVGTPNTGCFFATPPVSATFTATLAPTITIGGPNSICAGSSIDLSSIVTSNGPLTFHSNTPPSVANELPSTSVSPSFSTIYYAFASFGSGCSTTSPVPINVSAAGTPNLGAATVCESSGNLSLNTLLDPAFPSGVWSGPGVSGSTFNPSGQSGTVALTFTPNNSCATAATTNITVNQAATPTLGTTTLCSSSGLFNLSTLGDPLFPTGTWTGPGVVGTQFNPASQSGLVTVTFTPSAPCSLPQQTTIDVSNSIIPTLGSTSFCENNGPYDLTLLEDPLYPGGTWSGPNVSGTTFNTSNPGSFTLTYTAGAACTVPANSQIIVTAIQSPTLGTTSLCASSAPFNLVLIQDPSFPNGTWSGPGVSGNFFDPAGQVGGAQLTYTPSDPCTAPSQTNISVSPSGAPSLGTSTVCSSSAAFNLFTTIGDPAYPTGTWSGLGVVGNFFNPAGQNGNVTINFNPSDPCASSTSTTITVDPVQTPTLSTASTCASAGLVNLNALQDPSLPNGTWSGPGVTGTSFNPAAFSGFVNLTFTPSDPCTAPSTTTIDVQATITPDLNTALICENAPNYNLNLLVDPAFPVGTWSGPGVSGGFFDPSGLTGANVLTFVPVASCATAGTTAIDVEPSGTPQLNTTTLCSSAGIYDLAQLEDPSFGSGVWSGQGVSGNLFNPIGLDGNISLVFNPNDPCASSATTFIAVTVSQTPSLGSTSLCANAAPYNLIALQDPNFLAGTWSGPGVSGTSFNPSSQNGLVNLTFTSNAACAIPASTSINVNPIITPSLSSAVICENSAPINLSSLVLSGGSAGTWTGNGVSLGFFNPTGQSGNSVLTFSPSSQCAVANTTPVTVNPPLAYNSLAFDCQGGTIGYVVSFNITGGDPSNYLVNGNPVGQSYLSSLIPSGTPFSYLVSDANGCGPLTINGDFDCSCATFSGTMNITGPLTQLCQNQSFNGVFNNNQTLDPDDVLQFVLHDNPGATLGNVLATGATPNFAFPAGGTLNTTYYVSAVAGTSNGSGGVLTTDPCISVSQGIPVRWYGLSVTANASGAVCASDCFPIQVQTTGVPPLRLFFTVTGPNGTRPDTVILNSNNTTFDFCPSDYNLGVGAYSFQAIQLSDPNCILPLSQNLGALQVVRPSSTLVQSLCQGESLTVGNQVFTQSNATGTVILQGASLLGCDSTIQVQLSFTPSANTTIQQQLCSGSTATIGGQTFNASNPSGTVVLSGASVAGCDSIIQVDLSFVSATVGAINQQICASETVTVGSQTFSASNPVGSVTLPGASYLGCDSIVNISLSVRPIATGTLNLTLCPGATITIGSQTFSQANPSGQIVFPNGSVYGCDSTVQVNASFGNAVINQLVQILCPGESLTVGTQVFNQSNPSGSVTFPNGSVFGCDSIVQVALAFNPAATAQYVQQICGNQTVTVGNQTFSSLNPSGTVVLPGAAVTGCDSTVQVNLSFANAAQNQVSQTLCPGEVYTVGNQTFTQSNPNGTITLTGAAASGCDSIITVNLSYRTAATSSIQQQLCTGGSLSVGSQVFNQANPSGTVVLAGAATTGCDSIVQIALTFGNAVIVSLSPQICIGETYQVGTQTFSQTNPTGSVTFPNGSTLGCDSVVQVNVNFLPAAIANVQQQLCTGSSLTIGNQTFNQANPTGSVILQGAAVGGCDSTILVALTFGSAVVNVLNPSLCVGETFAVGAEIFSQANPSGSVSFPNGSVLGCDSIVQVNLSFITPAIGLVQQTLCAGQSLTIGTQVFNISNPTGTVLLAGAAVGGCDSTIQVNLLYQAQISGVVQQQLCPNGSIVVGGQTFNQANPTGSVVLLGAAANGCDSLVQVSLTFGNAVINAVTQTLCQGETYQVGNQTFNSTNPNGSVTFENGSVFGCDSIVQVNLSYLPEAMGTLQTRICQGDTIFINGTAYHQANRSGQEFFEAGSALGCDSTLNISLSFYETPTVTLDTIIGISASVSINGTTYNLNNLEGTEIFTSANGCDSIVYVRVRLDKKYDIAVPNVFSPDGIIPFVTLYGGTEIAEIEVFQVFTRWGEEVFRRTGFQPNTPELGWDGLHRGKLLNPGVYVYQARVRYIDGASVLFDGDVTLIR